MKDFISKELRLGCLATPIAIPLGMVLVFLVMGIVMWDLGAAFGIIALSIICTAGVGLLIWIPIWYAVGYGVLIVLRVVLPLFGMDISAIFERKKAKPALSRDQQALLNYIKKARAKGLSDQQISRKLASNGWSNDSINAGFQMA